MSTNAILPARDVGSRLGTKRKVNKFNGMTEVRSRAIDHDRKRANRLRFASGIHLINRDHLAWIELLGPCV